MVQVLCKIGPGLRDSERTAAVLDVHDRRHFLRVEEGFIGHEGGRTYLPVGVVGVDRARGLVLIELPHEADSGANRLWVYIDETTGIRRGEG